MTAPAGAAGISDAMEQKRPRHVAIIMDGNGRWAEARKKDRSHGHRKGLDSVRMVIETSVEYGIAALTLFTFSSENWRRPRREVRGLMDLFVRALRDEVEELAANGVRVSFAGDVSAFGPVLQREIRHAERRTADLRRLRLNVAANYGGRWHVADAVARLLRDESRRGADQGADTAHGPPDNAAIQSFITRHLDASGVGDVDLLIRTGGESRLSNFLLWQCAYAELYFTPVPWPAFDRAEYDKALAWFARRERRFGGVEA